jgi:ketosteroid isomerase-like protein
MDHAAAQAFAERWVRDWNAHDIDALLGHFTDDVVFTSPVAVRLFGGDGVIRGKEALRKYWSEGVRLIPQGRARHLPGASPHRPRVTRREEVD